MSDLIPERPPKPINQVRSDADNEARKITSSELGRVLEREWHVFIGVESNQVTQALVVNWLKAEEAFYREEVTQAFSGQYMKPYQLYDYSHWEEVSEALKGSVDEGPISKTIDYLRKGANEWGNLAQEARKKISGGGPFENNFIQEIETVQCNERVWEGIAERLKLGARLFEKQPKWSTTEEVKSEEV